MRNDYHATTRRASAQNAPHQRDQTARAKAQEAPGFDPMFVIAGVLGLSAAVIVLFQTF